MNNIIQFSTGRSGSTLLWNILKELQFNPKKCHNLKYNVNCKIVSTIRDPRDMLASRLLISNKKIDNENINENINQMKKYGLDDLVKIMNKKNVLVLQYEFFWNNYEYIFDRISEFLNINIDQDVRKKITTKFSVEKMLNISKKFDNFNSFDKKTHIHGNHISKKKGEPGNWMNVIPKKYHQEVEKKLKKYLNLFSYE